MSAGQRRGPAVADRHARSLGLLPSNLGVALHVKCVHLVKDKSDGVLANDAEVSTHRR